MTKIKVKYFTHNGLSTVLRAHLEHLFSLEDFTELPGHRRHNNTNLQSIDDNDKLENLQTHLVN